MSVGRGARADVGERRGDGLWYMLGVDFLPGDRRGGDVGSYGAVNVGLNPLTGEQITAGIGEVGGEGEFGGEEKDESVSVAEDAEEEEGEGGSDKVGMPKLEIDIWR